MCPVLASLVPDWSALGALALVATALFAGWFLARGGGGTALAELQRANGILDNAVKDHRVRIAALEKENAELRGRTDVALAIEHALNKHEDRAQQRFETTTVILGLIAERLGPEAAE